jgi:hypothetical protein
MKEEPNDVPEGLKKIRISHPQISRWKEVIKIRS